MIIANRKIQMNNLEKFVYKHSSEFKFNDNGINYCFKYEWTCWKLINETTGGLLAEGEGYVENGSLDPLNPNCSKENMIKWVLDQGIYLYEGELEPSIKDIMIELMLDKIQMTKPMYKESDNEYANGQVYMNREEIREHIHKLAESIYNKFGGSR